MEVHTHKPHCKTIMFWQSNIYFFPSFGTTPLLPSDPNLIAVFRHLPFHLSVQLMTSALFVKWGFAL